MTFTKQPIGFRRIPTTDPEEQRLRELCYASSEAYGVSSPEYRGHYSALEQYVWQRAERIVAADRAKHPKAKRNAPIGSERRSSDKTNGPIEVPHIEGFTK